MGYVLRFIGAILATVVFAMIAVLFHFLFFVGAAHFFANISWHSLFSFDSYLNLYFRFDSWIRHFVPPSV